MNTKALWGLVVVLFAVIVAMTWALFAIPTPVRSPVATSTPTTPVEVPAKPVTPAAPQPLSKRVHVTAPLSNTAVGTTFLVKGEAPGPWFFEASFPIQVRDDEGSVIARTHANALGEWMTTDQVKFSATVNIDVAYKGPATLILMRDNPSGLPENDDAVEIPITIQ